MRRSILSPGVRVHSYARDRLARCCCTASTSGATRSCATRSSTRTCRSREGAQIGVDPEADRERFAVSRRRHRRDREGREGRGALKVALLTREYPPEVYGGAGVHVEYLARELARLVDLTVHCWGGERPARQAGRPCAPTGRGRPLPGAVRTPRRSRRSRSTSPWPRASRAPRSCTATPGTPTSPGTWPSCSTASRTSRPCTASSRCGRGRPSSSPAAMRSRASASARRWRPPTPSSPSRASRRATCSRATRPSIPGA